MTGADALKWLRSPRGQVWLFGSTFAASLVLSGVMALNRPFFEGYVREKLPTPSSEAVTLASQIKQGRIAQAQAVAQARTVAADLYAAWMASPTGPGQEHLAKVMMESAPDYYLARIERTLVTGTEAQRLRAVLLAELSRSRDARPILQRALARAEAQRRSHLQQALQQAIGSASAEVPAANEMPLPSR